MAVVCRWDMTEWSECSTSCDRGQQTRTVECKQRISAVLSVPVTADRCIHEPRPPTVRTCNGDRPCVRWRIGNWSQVRPVVLNRVETKIETESERASKVSKQTKFKRYIALTNTIQIRYNNHGIVHNVR